MTVRDLLANAVALDGKRVQVVGFFFYVREHVALYAIATRDRSPSEAVWIANPATIHGEKVSKTLTRKWVVIEGTFHNRSKSKHMGYSGIISNIACIQLADPPESSDRSVNSN